MYYSILAGFGMGLTYFLPVLCGWSYFPWIRPVVAGSILSWFTWVSMGYALYTTDKLNPDNLPPDVPVIRGDATVNFYHSDSDIVKQIPDLLTTYAITSLIIALIGIPFIMYNSEPEPKKVNQAYESVKQHLPTLSVDKATPLNPHLQDPDFK